MANAEEQAATEALDVTEMIPTSIDQVGQLWAQVQEIVAVWGLKVIAAIAIFVIGRWVAMGVRKGVRRVMEKADTDPIIVGFVGSISYIALLAFVIIAALGQLGIQTTSFIAILGAAGLAIGLALKDSLSNFAQGVMLIIFQPFKKGHFVEAGGTSGVVEEVRIFNTVLRTGDNKQVIIPNSIIGSDTITNYSMNATRRIDFVMGVGYDDDLKLAREVMAKVCDNHPLVLKDPATNIFVLNLGASSVDFAVRPWVKTDDYWKAYGELLESFKVELDAAGCNIPYPQTDVHLHQVNS